MGYYDLAREVRLSLTVLKKTLPALEGEKKVTAQKEIILQTSRLEDLGLRVASALIEMEDLEGATRHLKSLSSGTSPGLMIQKALLWLYLGDIDSARSSISSSYSSPSSTSTSISANTTEEGRTRQTDEAKVILALAQMCDSEYEAAILIWSDLIASSSSPITDSEIPMYQQNLAVCYLYLGNIERVRLSSPFFPLQLFFSIQVLLTPFSQAKEILEQLVGSGHTFHALTFNLSTIYELCTERSRALKIGLAEQVAEMQLQEFSGGFDGVDGTGEKGVRVNGRVGWEKVNGDFKL